MDERKETIEGKTFSPRKVLTARLRRTYLPESSKSYLSEKILPLNEQAGPNSLSETNDNRVIRTSNQPTVCPFKCILQSIVQVKRKGVCAQSWARKPLPNHFASGPRTSESQLVYALRSSCKVSRCVGHGVSKKVCSPAGQSCPQLH